MILGFAILASLIRQRYSAPACDELVLLIHPVAVLLLVSSQTGINIGLRYALPVLPFLFVWMSKVSRAFDLKHTVSGCVVVVFALWSIVSSLSVYPHSLSYFNELAGGPRGGPSHLLDSNIDWGQDLLFLRAWLDRHPEVTKIGLAYYVDFIDPSIAGIDYTEPPKQEPAVGWYAVSVNKLHCRKGDYEYFLHTKPVAMVGYSIYIYHLTESDVSRIKEQISQDLRSADHLERDT